MKDAIQYPEKNFVEALYMAVQKTKQFPKACSKWKKKPEWARNTQAQAKAYFKDMYELFDEQRDSLHEMGVANNGVMQEQLDSLAAENKLMRQDIVTNITRAKQYHNVIEHAMSLTRTTESKRDRDDTTLQTQFWAFTASQTQQLDTQFAQLRRQLDQCMSIRGGTLPKNINKNNFEECMRSSKSIAPIPSGSIEQMFRDKGPPEGTAAHQVLETSSKFNYRNVFGELMYVYITCRPDIGYAITTLSKFSSEPSAFHYKLLRGVAKYLRSTITWGICFNRPSSLNLDKLQDSVPYPELEHSKNEFPVDVNRPVHQVFTDAAFGNDLT